MKLLLVVVLVCLWATVQGVNVNSLKPLPKDLGNVLSEDGRLNNENNNSGRVVAKVLGKLAPPEGPEVGKIHSAKEYVREYLERDFENVEEKLRQLEEKVNATVLDNQEIEEIKAVFNQTLTTMGIDLTNITLTPRHKIRIALFTLRLHALNELSKAYDNITFSPSWISFLDDDEISVINGFRPNMTVSDENQSKTLLQVEASSTASLPSSFDWTDHGAIGPVINQGSCGSCWAVSGSEAMAGAMAVQNGYKFELAPQQLVDCATWGESGCNGGSYINLWNTYFGYAANNDLVPNSEYKYTGKQGSCSSSGKTSIMRVSGAYQLASLGTVSDTLMQENLLKQPMSVAISASCSGFQGYKSGILTATACTANCNAQIDHAVLLVGYGISNGVKYWKVKNSWGTEWGEGGYVRLEMNGNYYDSQLKTYGTCGINYSPAYPKIASFASSCNTNDCTTYGTPVNTSNYYNAPTAPNDANQMSSPLLVAAALLMALFMY